MPWAFLFVGFLLLVTAWRKKEKDLWRLLKQDFTGQGNFFYWVLAIIVLVALGSFRPIRPVSNAFLGLILLVIVLKPYKDGRDLFGELASQIKEGTS